MRLIILLLLIPLVIAIPPLPTEVYGTGKYFGENIPPGSAVRAYDQYNNRCGTFVVALSGYYGLLSCKGDDPSTTAKEGPLEGESIRFTYNHIPTYIVGNNTFSTASFRNVNFTVPIPVCGDGFCDDLYESCNICAPDCGICPESNESEGNDNGDNDLPRVPGGGGGSGGGASTGVQYLPGCVEKWECGEWGACGIDGLQNRECLDRNKCGTAENKPLVVQICEYVPTCFDGILNGAEQGIDCGGPCKPCIGCEDEIQNCHSGACEEGIDCGGPCPACPTCFDGVRNCHKLENGTRWCEEGIDCGGPCPECPSPLVELPAFICERVINPLNPYFIVFMVIIFLGIGIRVSLYQLRSRELQKNKSLDDLKRAKAYLSERRKMYMFLITTLIITAILIVYYYFFGLCRNPLRYGWILAILLVASPFLIHLIIKRFEYDEKRKLKHIELLHDTHHKQITTMLSIENEHLTELEEEVAGELVKMNTDARFASIKKEHPIFEKMHKQLVKLYTAYKDRKNPYGVEKELCEEIYALANDKELHATCSKYPAIKSVIAKLRTIYTHYEQKQALYDELADVERKAENQPSRSSSEK